MKYEGNVLKTDKELSLLDKKVIEFTEVLDDSNLKYVLVSGYIAILLGRSRGTEDVDVIIEELEQKETEKLVERLTEEGYWCINSSKNEIFDMLKDELAVRFAEKDKIIPNFEVRFAQDEFEKQALDNKIMVEIDSNPLYISPLELQIAYKLYLGSEKDFEDALHIYELFKDELDMEKVEKLCIRLDVGVKLNEIRES